MRCVLDASALLAFLFKEPGHEIVSARLRGAAMSAVNLSEVLGRFVRDGHPVEGLLAALLEAGLEIRPFDELQASVAAILLPKTMRLGLSLGDRACLALGLTLEGSVLTADHVWGQLALDLPIEIIR